MRRWREPVDGALRRAAGEAGVIRGVVVKDLRVLRRYPLETINSLVQPLYQFIVPSLLLSSTFLVGGEAVGFAATTGTADVAGFLVLGMVISYLVGGAFWGIGYSFKGEMDRGTLEPAWLSPARRESFVLGRALGVLVVSGAGSLLVMTAAMALGVRFAPDLVFALPAIALAAVSIVAVGYVVTAFVLLAKEPTFLVDASDLLFNGLSGVAFPIIVLPGVLQAVSMLLPTTYAIDLLRVYALGSEPLVPPLVGYAALAALAALFVPLGRLAFRFAERRLAATGSTAQH
jgi:ABC-type multidrug transport system permease subunit